MSNYYKIDGLLIISGPFILESETARSITGNGNPEVMPSSELLKFGIVPEEVEATTATQKYGTPYVHASKLKVILPATNKSADELTAEKVQYINSIFDAAEQYVDLKGKVDGTKGRVSKYSIGVLTMKASANRPKSKAINDWCNSVFALAYTREAQVNGGVPFTADMLDFSSCGEMPHTIAEALQE